MGDCFRHYQISLPKYLYKYFRNTDNLKKCLMEQYIHLEKPDEYNDVFDSAISLHVDDLKRIPAFGQPVELLKFFTHRDYKTEVEKVNFQECNNMYVAFEKTRAIVGEDNYQNTLNEFLKRLQNIQAYNNRIACFSESNDSVLMWAHYGNALKGGCLCFDTSKDIKLFSHAQKVNYTQLRPHRNNFEQYFTKSAEWAYEQEWRIVEESEKIETPSCSGIIIGEKMEEDKFFELAFYANKIGIPVYKAKADPEIYKIRITEWLIPQSEK